MRYSVRRAVGALLISLAITGHAGADQPGVAFGDGLGTISGFDSGRRTVMIGGQQVLLTVEAFDSLTRQLAELGWRFGTPFGAEYTVNRGLDGAPVVDSISVFPPRLK